MKQKYTSNFLIQIPKKIVLNVEVIFKNYVQIYFFNYLHYKLDSLNANWKNSISVDAKIISAFSNIDLQQLKRKSYLFLVIMQIYQAHDHSTSMDITSKISLWHIPSITYSLDCTFYEFRIKDIHLSSRHRRLCYKWNRRR